MKMRSIKTMALWFTVAVLSSSAGGFAHHSHHGHHSHSHHCALPIHDPEVFIGPAEAALNTIVGDLNSIFVAEAFSKTMPSPGSTLAALISAENGPGAGSIIDAETAFQNILIAVGVPQATASAIMAQIDLFSQAAQKYSLDVSTGQPVTVQAADLANWFAQGSTLAAELASLSPRLDPTTIQNLINNLINSESWAIQAYNFPPGFIGGGPNAITQMATAVQLTQQAHADATALAELVIGQLVKGVNHAACPRP